MLAPMRLLFAVLLCTTGCQGLRMIEPATCEVPAEAEVFEDLDHPEFQKAELIGGLSALRQQMRYPETPKRNGIGGEVVVSFIVAPSGCVAAAKVTASVHPELDEEALRVVTASRFTPARLSGEPVAMRLTLPFTWKVRVN